MSPHVKALDFFKDGLDRFRSSQDQLQILCEAPRHDAGSPLPQDVPRATTSSNGDVDTANRSKPRLPRRVVVLDASFNPPTRAHMQMATSAIRSTEDMRHTRLVLLLAVNNADKAPKPASFEQRLAMMNALAQDVYEELAGDDDAGADDASDGGGDHDGHRFGIDLALTTLPYFHDKSAALAAVEETAFEPPRAGRHPVEQVFLIGYDTLIRLFNPKYYSRTAENGEAVNGIREALSPLFGRARMRLTLRADADWGGREDQLAYLEKVTHGDALEQAGGLKEWASRIEVAEAGDAQGLVSSTSAREAASKGDWARLRELVPPRVAAWVKDERLYQESE
ncbi:hypothetical protein PpBr36_03060 [Pyricularia pennisetigena]|uniref:hypothetical protein n=1 Tax=Pyricularia pennisetigena TaxID=1578925 RepID=UPI001150EFEA|nr:hypothetical protein PpBr36_03060 [Pyricularia pennisetigena]TLS30989.1 hypothetical protein PpBr36_03060 [Pyricularia pennisetigena]